MNLHIQNPTNFVDNINAMYDVSNNPSKLFLDTSAVLKSPIFFRFEDSLKAMTYRDLYIYFSSLQSRNGVSLKSAEIKKAYREYYALIEQACMDYSITIGPTSTYELIEDIHASKDYMKILHSFEQHKQRTVPAHIPKNAPKEYYAVKKSFFRGEPFRKESQHALINERKFINNSIEQIISENISGIKRVLRSTSVNRSETEFVLKNYGQAYEFFFDLFRRSYQKYLTSNFCPKEKRKVNTSNFKDCAIFAEAAVFALMRESHAEIITGDNDFEGIAYNAIQIVQSKEVSLPSFLKGRSFSLGVVLRYDDNKITHSSRVEYIIGIGSDGNMWDLDLSKNSKYAKIDSVVNF